MGSYIRDHSGAVTLSLLLHAAIVLLLVSGLNFSSARQIRAPEPQAIEVVLVSSDAVPITPPPRDDARLERERLERERLEQERLEQERQEQARLERERLEERRQEQLRVEREQREAAERDAEAQRAEEARAALEQAQREQEAERVAAEAAERERREAERLAEERRREQERLEQERLAEQRRAEEERLAEQRRIEEARRQQEARERALMEEELQRALAQEQAVMEARRSGEFDLYLRQIQAAIERAWIPPASAREGLECIVNVTQIPSGDVISAQIGACNGDDAVRRSIEAAVLRASPLPTPSIPALFDRNLQVIFRPEF